MYVCMYVCIQGSHYKPCIVLTGDESCVIIIALMVNVSHSAVHV